jgi:hypothetical protein
MTGRPMGMGCSRGTIVPYQDLGVSGRKLVLSCDSSAVDSYSSTQVRAYAFSVLEPQDSAREMDPETRISTPLLRLRPCSCRSGSARHLLVATWLCGRQDAVAWPPAIIESHHARLTLLMGAISYRPGAQTLAYENTGGCLVEIVIVRVLMCLAPC